MKKDKILKFSATHLPNSLKFNKETGVISGTPHSDVGVYEASIKAITESGSNPTGKVRINVIEREELRPVVEDEVLNLIVNSVMENYTLQGKNIVRGQTIED